MYLLGMQAAQMSRVVCARMLQSLHTNCMVQRFPSPQPQFGSICHKSRAVWRHSTVTTCRRSHYVQAHTLFATAHSKNDWEVVLGSSIGISNQVSSCCSRQLVALLLSTITCDGMLHRLPWCC